MLGVINIYVQLFFVFFCPQSYNINKTTYLYLRHTMNIQIFLVSLYVSAVNLEENWKVATKSQSRSQKCAGLILFNF